MNVQHGTPRDIESWMALVRQLRKSLPGLETEQLLQAHRQTVLRFMAENRALCVMTDGRAEGVLLLSYTHNTICCLAVAEECRRRGIATALLSAGLKKLDRSRDIEVFTFRAEDERGIAPRALYRQFGFEEDALLIEYGCPVQRFLLRAEGEATA